jgi:hypothetical protein
MANPKKEIAITNQITLLVEAINCDNQETARLLVRRALNVVYDNKKSQWSFDDKADVEVNSSEFDAVVALIRSVKPKDSVEAILAAQFVALHLQGMNALANDCGATKGHGMMMVRLSHQALEVLQRYREKSQLIINSI